MENNELITGLVIVLIFVGLIALFAFSQELGEHKHLIGNGLCVIGFLLYQFLKKKE